MRTGEPVGSRTDHDACPECGAETWWEKQPGHMSDDKRCPNGHVWHYELAAAPAVTHVVQVRGEYPPSMR